ncbi:hypothetical protein HPB49_001332 [Dermacentor silvarum]|uniref:Uncharacterized protein n=1 Tax=Dermacentor silvarum TaxID=543639 RepID=A0ACB8CCV0_DERSI|nr:hypothetical protein HPB49_001332 [Dermacentor silvarum]
MLYRIWCPGNRTYRTAMADQEALAALRQQGQQLHEQLLAQQRLIQNQEQQLQKQQQRIQNDSAQPHLGHAPQSSASAVASTQALLPVRPSPTQTSVASRRCFHRFGQTRRKCASHKIRRATTTSSPIWTLAMRLSFGTYSQVLRKITKYVKYFSKKSSVFRKRSQFLLRMRALAGNTRVDDSLLRITCL